MFVLIDMLWNSMTMNVKLYCHGMLLDRVLWLRFAAGKNYR